MPNYFRRSIIEAGRQIVEEYNEQPRNLKDIAQILQENSVSTGGDYKTAIALIENYGHQLFDNSGEFDFTPRCILLNLIKATNPPWLSPNQTGRKSVISNIMNDLESYDIVQCFEDAGLLESSKDDEVTKWWKMYVKHAFSREELSNLEIIGLAGEEKTRRYERDYLKSNGIDRDIIDIATEDSKAGYDILSWRKNGENLKERLIESKMTEQNRFFFSRNAFNTAFKNQDTYVVYLWTSQAENPIEFYYKDLIKHIPEDRGSGTWTNVEITV